jgi:anti-sigma B factor antagonist
MTSPQPSRVSINNLGDRTLAISGTIDSHTAEQVLASVNALGANDDLVITLRDVDFVDSSGLRTIVTAHQHFDESGRRLILKEISPSVERLLEITGLHEHLHLA